MSDDIICIMGSLTLGKKKRIPLRAVTVEAFRGRLVDVTRSAKTLVLCLARAFELRAS